MERMTTLSVILVCLCAPTNGFQLANSTAEPTSGPPTWSSTLGERTGILVMAASLAIIGILFEAAKEAIEERTSEAMEPILRGFYGELMVGGFMSILSFVLVKFGALQGLSEKLYEDEEFLPELLENLHIVLFLVFMIFLVQALYLLLISSIQEKSWRLYEGDEPMRGSGCWARYRRRSNLAYDKLREAFISPPDPTATKLDPKFRFNEYLSLCVGQLVGQIVVITPWVWLVTIIFFVVNWALDGAQAVTSSILFLAIGWILLGISLIIFLKLNWIHKQVAPTLHIPSKSNSVNLSQDYSLLSDPDIKAGLPAYHARPLHPRSKLGRFFLGPQPHKHQQLFWFDAKGKSFLITCVSSLMLISAMYIAIYSFIIIRELIQSNNQGLAAVLGILSLLPVVFTIVFMIPLIISKLLIVGSVELLKDKRLVKKVIRDMRARRTVRTLKLLQSMRRHARMFKAGSEAKSLNSEAAAHIELAEEQEEEIRQIFSLFDSDGGGSISTDELQELMGALGHVLDDHEAKAMMVELDTDDNGTLEVGEFINYMKLHIAGEGEEDEEETIEDLFHLFDKNKDGHISVEEFQQTLSVLGEPLTQAEILELLQELDDGDGNLDMEEFKELIEKFSKE